MASPRLLRNSCVCNALSGFNLGHVGLASIEESSNGVCASGGRWSLRNRTEHNRTDAVREQVRRLPETKRSVLQGLWRDLYGYDPPEKISHQLLRQGVAYRLQVKHLGG